VWHWIEEDGERSLQVRPLLKGKIWTLNENYDDDMNLFINGSNASLCVRVFLSHIRQIWN